MQTSVDGVTRTMIYDIFGQNIADYGYVGSGLERENFYRAGQLLATREFPTTQNVVWTGATGVTVSGNSISKSGTTGWGYSGAVSTQAIVSGDGYAEFTADSLDYGMYGLSHDNPDLHFNGIDYAIYTERAEGRVYVYENGTPRGQVGTWTSGDRFSVAVEGGVVKYKKNNTVLYTSSVSPTYPLFVDTSLYNGNTLSNVVISGDFTGAGLRYVLQDIQGTARVVMKSDGTVAARHDYLPFGEEIGTLGSRTTTPGYGGADANRWNYALTQRDQKSGLDHTWFRKHEGLSGRWTSPDPDRSSIVISNPQTINRFAYVHNDPVNFSDPSGLDPDLDEGLDAALIMAKWGPCASLFRGTNAAALIKSYQDNQGTRIYTAPLRSGGKPALGVGASTNRETGVIKVNVEGAYMTGMAPVYNMIGGRTTMRSVYEVGIFSGLSRIEMRAVTLIHELLHAIGSIPDDGPNAPKGQN